MYVPPAFSEKRLDVLHQFIRQHSFATLITTTPAGPTASHVPIVLHPDHGPLGSLQFHLARQNDQQHSLTSDSGALMIFHGPHAYISPTWYKSPVAVPTWNYLAVHAYGCPRTLNDAQLADHLRVLSSHYEPADGWTPQRLPPDVFDKMRRNIIGFEIQISRIEGKWKLNQNRSQEDMQGAMAGLSKTGNVEGMKVADLMSEAMREKTP